MKIYNCEVCGAPKTKQIPAGTSKTTGKAYQAFMVCEKGCKKPKPTINTTSLEERLIKKFEQIDQSIKDLEDAVFNVKTLDNATSKEDEATNEDGLPF